MAINAQSLVESRRYSGWTDPRYPIGYWQAALTLTGDATGGNLGIDLVFQDAVNPRLNSQMYSVERFAIRGIQSLDRVVKIIGVNMGGPSNLGFSQEYAVELSRVTSLSIGTFLRGEAMNIVPWFLGAQQIPGFTASLSMIAENIDTITFKFEAEGYRWGARSVLVDGGPQRPPTGLYRQ